jgi:hypothetical protein
VPSDKAIALFVCNKVAPTLEMAYAVHALQKSQKIRPVVLLGSRALLKRLPNGLFSDSEVLVFADVLRPFPMIDIPRIYGVLARISRLFRLHVLADYLLIKRNVVQGTKVFQKLLKRYRIKVVLIADDRSLSSEIGLICAAKSNDIATITLPFALSDPDADAVRRISDHNFIVSEGRSWEVAIKRKLAVRFPENIRKRAGKQLMFLTAGQAIALRQEKLIFTAPWAYGGGVTDVACVYGQAIKNMQIRLGVSESKLEVIGQCSMDILYSQWKSRPRTEDFRKSEDELVVLFSMPQFLEHGMLTRNEHEELYEALFQAFGSIKNKIVLSLHPRARKENYDRLAAKYGLLISDRRLIDLLPDADIFAATNSSTLRWAALMHIPTVVLDLFKVGPGGMYEEGVFYVTQSAEEFSGAIFEFIRNPTLRELYKKRMIEISPQLDPFDGNNSTRIRSLIESYCA